MHAAPDSVANIVAHYRISVGLGVRLHYCAYVTDVIPNPALLDRQLQTFFGNPD
jgi:hypothetical protein